MFAEKESASANPIGSLHFVYEFLKNYAVESGCKYFDPLQKPWVRYEYRPSGDHGYVKVEKVESVSIGGDFKDAEVHVPCVAGGLLGLTTASGANNVNAVPTDRVTWKWPDGCSHAPKAPAPSPPSTPTPPKSGALAVHGATSGFAILVPALAWGVRLR